MESKIILSLHDQSRIISALEMKVEIYKKEWREEILIEYKKLINKMKESASDTFHLQLTNISQNQKPKKQFKKLVNNNGKNKNNNKWWEKL